MAKYDFNAYRKSQDKKKKNPFEEALERATKPVASTSKNVASQATKLWEHTKNSKSIVPSASKSVAFYDTEGNPVTEEQASFITRSNLKPTTKAEKIAAYGLDTLGTDITDVTKSVDAAAKGWQSREFMKETKPKIQSLYDKLQNYKDYRAEFGGEDLSDITKQVKDILDSWDDRTENYSQYQNAEAYNAEQQTLKKLYNGMSSAEIKGYMDNPSSAPGFGTTKKLGNLESDLFGDLGKSTAFYDDELGTVSLEDQISYKHKQNAKGGTDNLEIAYTTVSGQNITWRELFDKALYKENTDNAYAVASSDPKFQEYKTAGAKSDYSIVNQGTRAGASVSIGNDLMAEIAAASNMDEKELAIYHYYLGKEKAGELPDGYADKYFQSILPQLQERSDNRALSAMREFSRENPLAGFAVARAAKLGSAVENLWNVGNYIAGNGLKDNRTAKIGTALDAGVTDVADFKVGGYDVADLLYNTAASGVDTVIASKLGKGGTMGVLGSAAMGAGINEALDRGLSEDQAFWNGVAAGVFEGLFETFSIGKMQSLKSVTPKTFKDAVNNTLKNMGVNASEESLTDLSNIFYDFAAHGDLSQAATIFRAYQNGGMSENEAIAQIAKDQAWQVSEAGLSGALMGLGFDVSNGNLIRAYNKQNVIKAWTQFIDEAQAKARENGDVDMPGTGLVQNKFSDKMDADKAKVLDIWLKDAGLRGNLTNSVYGGKANASISGTNVKFDANSIGDNLWVGGHEITHRLQRLAPEAYAKFEKAALKQLSNNYLLETAARYKAANVDIDAEGIIQEAVADYSGAILEGGEALDNFIAENKSDRGLLRSMWDAVRGVADDFTGRQSEQARIVEAKLAEELTDAEKNTAQTDGVERFSIGEIVSDTGENYGIGVILDTSEFGKTPPRRWGVPLKNFMYEKMAGSKLTMYDNNGMPETVYIARANDRVKKDGAKNDHKVIDKLARYKGDNIKALATAHVAEILEVSGNETFNDEHNHQWLDENGWRHRTVYLQDVYGKIYEATLNIADGRDRLILYDITNIREIGKKRETTRGAVPSSKRRGSLTKGDSSKDSISQPDPTVKRDSDGRTLSEGQQEYFKDSKVRDENGNLLVMYHGTSNSGFTVFDTYGGKFGLFGMGSYFTADKSVAESYTRKGKGSTPGVYEVYLDVKNPLDMDASADIDKWKTAFKNFDLDASYLEGVQTNEDAFRALKENLEDLEYIRWEAEETVTEMILGMGYDGITHIGGGRFNANDDNRHRVYIIFQPEQAKNVDNAKPTTNPDIRFSIKMPEAEADEFTGRQREQARIVEAKLAQAINDDENLENKNTAQTDGERYAVKEVLPLTDTEYKQNCKSLVNMESVADLVGNELDGGGPLKQRIEALFDSFGRNVYTERFGDVALSNSSIRSDIRHGTTKDKVTAYAAIPQVLKNGVVIDYLKKGYGEVSRIVVAAPIKIANTPYIMGAMIQRDKTNQRLYLHDVVIKKEASAYQPEHLNTTGPLDSENLFTTEVLEKALSVGYSILQNQSKIKGNPSTNFDIPEQFSIKLPEIDTDVDAVNAEDATVDEKLSQLREDYGVIPKGEKPHRDVELPQQTAKDKYVSQTVRTILEAKATPEIALKPIETLVAEGELSYDRYTDKAAQADAETIIRNKGWDNVISEWINDSKNGSLSKKHTALGWALYNNAVNSGNMETALNILNHIVGNQRNAAQALQATRILKKLSPESQLYQVVRSVASLQEDLNNKYREGKAPELKINEVLANAFMTAETQEARDTILKDIYKDIGRQMPPKFSDKWRAWRYLAMLGNPRTHVRNILGNAVFTPVVAVKDMTATAIESLVSRVSGGKFNRTKAYGKGMGKLVNAAWGDYENVSDIISNGGKYTDGENANRYIRDGQKLLWRPFEAVRKFNSKAMETEDMWFSKPHYAFALAQYCKANGITEAQIKAGEIPSVAREYAIREAQKATYRDTNILSHFISKRFRESGEFKAGAKVANTLIDGILPFRKTPANILVRGLEYSPLGLAKTIIKGTWDVAIGNITGAEFIDNLSSGITGTGLMGLGMYLAAQGLVRGHGSDDEKEREFEELMGHQGYSLELPNGTSVTLDWLAPEALPFFVGVNMYEKSAEADDGEPFTLSEGLEALGTITEPMLEMSCLQSLNSLFESVGYATSNDMSALTTIVSSALSSFFTQAFPTILGQAERTGESESYTTFTEKNAFLTPDIQRTLGNVSRKIPGWDFQQIPYIDAWGRTEKTGNVIERAFTNFLNPAYTSDVEESRTEKELKRLYDATGEGGVFPQRADKYFTVDGKKKYLSEDEYTEYATEKGETSYRLLRTITESREYKDLSDVEKADVVSFAYDYANQKAKESASNFKPEDWVLAMDEAKKLGISEIDFILINKMQSGKAEDVYKTLLTSKQKMFVDSTVKEENSADMRRIALLERTDLTPEQKAYIDKTCISELKRPIDYSSEDSFFFSKLTEAKQKRYPEVVKRWGNIDAKTYYRILDACSGLKKKDDIIAKLYDVGFYGDAAYRFYNVVFKP